MPVRELMHDSYAIAQAGYDAAIAEAEHAHRQAEIIGDTQQMAVAQQNIVALRGQKRDHESMSRDLAQTMMPDPDANPRGLTKDEEKIARGFYQDNPNMSDDQRDLVYLQGKHKYQNLLASGYRDERYQQAGKR